MESLLFIIALNNDSVRLYKVFPKMLWAFPLYCFQWKVALLCTCNNIKSRDDCMSNDLVVGEGITPTVWFGLTCSELFQIVKSGLGSSTDPYIHINNSTIVYTESPIVLDLEDPKLNDSSACSLYLQLWQVNAIWQYIPYLLVSTILS